MKIIFITLSIFLTLPLIADELSWVDEQVEAIKPARSGMKSRDISKIKDPFIFLPKNRNEKEKISKNTPIAKTTVASTNSKTIKVKNVNKILTLNLIMNNSAMISGEWYKLEDMVNGYKIVEISPQSVLLRKNKKELLLSTMSNNRLKFKK
ncbi:MAG: hypothetical protein U9N39_00720 [Campylobacterota bacterium]|nr:hypothetical protein [Campylobacterota bacterium]